MSILREKISKRSEFIVTCEFVPGRGCSGAAVEEALRFGEKLAQSSVPIHAISITDNPGGNPAISPDVIADELARMKVESLVHVSCAGLNRNSFESRLSGLARRGLENTLIITGDYPEGGYRGVAKPVFDLDSVQAIRYLKDMNCGIEIPGGKGKEVNRLPATGFFAACAVNPFGKNEAELITQYVKLEKKIDAGADCIIPNLGYDIRKFAEIQKYLKHRNITLPLFGNCYVLSRPVARIMNKGAIPGCVVSDELLKVIEKEAEAPDKGKGARLERAAQMVALFKGMRFQGVHLGGFGLKFDDFAHILQRSDEIAGQWHDFIPNFQFARKEDHYLFPEDPTLTFAASTTIPVPARKSRPFSINFQMSKLIHHQVFTKGTPGFALARAYYRIAEKNRVLSEITYFMERMIKRVLFDCQECGDCAIFHVGYLCPMSQCAKFQRNGPCGGSRPGGWCEADEHKQCVWVRACNRFSPLDAPGALKGYVPPVNFALAKTSSWQNYFLGKDHFAAG
jgi:methylenetetrahydrofolate reductase (NADPH)